MTIDVEAKPNDTEHDAWSDAPWILSLTDQIQQALTHKVPVVGICFGHQILARALGAKVGRGDSWEISVGNVDLTESGKALFGKDTLVRIPSTRDDQCDKVLTCIYRASNKCTAISFLHYQKVA